MANKKQIIEGYTREYGRLKSDLSTKGEERGLLSLIRDSLLDLDMFSSVGDIETGE